MEAALNGARVSDDLLTPGWSSYEWRVRVAETDVTALVAANRRSNSRSATGGTAGA